MKVDQNESSLLPQNILNFPSKSNTAPTGGHNKGRPNLKSPKSCSNIEFFQYLTLLSFNELLLEASDIIKKLNNNTIDEEMSLQACLILEEFNKRLGRTSKQFTFDVGLLKQKIHNHKVRVNQAT